MDREARVLVRVFTSLRGNRVPLVREGFPGVNRAVLEHRSRVTEDKVNGTVDVAVAVELSERVGVESVLIAEDIAAVNDGSIGADT